MNIELGALEDLHLSGDELNLIIIGSGHGEAIIVDLPGSGWLVIDGAGRTGDYPVVELLAKHLRDQRVEALVLTHPHHDHFHGMLELLDHEWLGARIVKIGCVGNFVERDEGEQHSFALETVDRRRPAVPIKRRATASAKAVLRRIREIWTEEPERRLDIRRGTLPLDNPNVLARVLYPDDRSIEEFFHKPGCDRRIAEQANLLSAVIELRFGRGRYLLTSDLSDPKWAPLAEVETDLQHHAAAKLPHHGSANAQPIALLRSAGGARTWALTPFNRGRKLPTLAGLAGLLQHEHAVYMTAFPVSWKQTRPAPDRVSLNQLKSESVQLREDLGPVEAASRRDLAARDCFWLFSFDAQGQLLRMTRGQASTRIERG
ncbi:MAG: MBL fold metallo-hydrolase [Deltaproteobacteria bacterium]|nr:MBL fold metallo-hydrolase [Deltaproteobacteria bacterium]